MGDFSENNRKKTTPETNNIEQESIQKNTKEVLLDEKNKVTLEASLKKAVEEMLGIEKTRNSRKIMQIITHSLDQNLGDEGRYLSDLPEETTVQKTAKEMMQKNLEALKTRQRELKINYKLVMYETFQSGTNEPNTENWKNFLIEWFQYVDGINTLDEAVNTSNTGALTTVIMREILQEFGEDKIENLLSKLHIPEGWKYGPEIRLGNIEKVFSESWPSMKKALEKKQMQPEMIGKKEKRFRLWLATTELGNDISRRLLNTTVSPVGLLFMAYYTLNSPDKKKATIEYLSFIVAAEGVQVGIELGLKLLGEMAKKSDKLLKLLPRFEKLSKTKNIATLTATITLMIWAMSDEKRAEQIADKIDWISEQFDDDGIVWGTASAVMETLNIPFALGGNIFESLGFADIDPRHEQLEWMKNYVQREAGFISSIGNIGTDLTEHYNGMIDKKGSGSVERKFWNNFKIEDVKAWGQRQIPGFYGRSESLKIQEKQLEDALKKLTNPRTGKTILSSEQSLYYYETAVSGKVRNIQSNAEEVKKLDENNANAKAVKEFFILSLADSKDLNDPGYKNSLSVFPKEIAEKWEKDYEVAKKLWSALTKNSYELAREVDVYNYLGVYNQTSWNDPLNYPEAYSGYIDRLSWEENIRQDLEIKKTNDSGLRHQARSLVELTVSKKDRGVLEFLTTHVAKLWNDKTKEELTNEESATYEKAVFAGLLSGIVTQWGVEKTTDYLANSGIMEKIISGEKMDMYDFKGLEQTLVEGYAGDAMRNENTPMEVRTDKIKGTVPYGSQNEAQIASRTQTYFTRPGKGSDFYSGHFGLHYSETFGDKYRPVTVTFVIDPNDSPDPNDWYIETRHGVDWASGKNYSVSQLWKGPDFLEKYWGAIGNTALGQSIEKIRKSK